MKLGILGSGVVGRTLAAKLAALGNEVVIGTRDPAQLMARAEPGPMGLAPFAAWQAEHPAVAVATFADAATGAEIVINATSGSASLDALRAAGADDLRGRILIDISNPLDFSAGFPPTLLVCNTDSLGESIQREFPDTRVVKTLNTVGADVMVDPSAIGGGDHDAFISGDDAAAKETVSGLLRAWFGWRRVVDVGDITTARGTEMYLALWTRLFGTMGTSSFNVRVVN